MSEKSPHRRGPITLIGDALRAHPARAIESVILWGLLLAATSMVCLWINDELTGRWMTRD